MKDKRYKRLFLAYAGLIEDDIDNIIEFLGLTRRQADVLVDDYLTPKIKAAAEKSHILR